MVASVYKAGILIPAYNAASTIAAVVFGCRHYLDEILVIDDGSSDATGALAEAAGARVIRHEKNRGKGAALKTGFDEAMRLGWQGCITLDADQQHAPKDLPKFLAMHAQNPNALILGRRKLKQMPFASRFTRYLGLFFLSFSARHFISDTQCGYRLYPLPWLAQIKPSSKRFEWESEILLIAGRQNIPIRTVAVDTIYFTGEKRQKHVRSKDTWKIIFLFYESLRPNWLRERL